LDRPKPTVAVVPMEEEEEEEEEEEDDDLGIFLAELINIAGKISP